MSSSKPQTIIDAHVGQRLVQLRKKKRLSQREIATILGVTYQQVQKYENGSSRLGVEKIKILSKHFQIPNSYFFEELDNLQPSNPFSVSMGDEVLTLLSLFFQLKSPELRQELFETAQKILDKQTRTH